MRWRQRVSDERSNGSLCWKNSSPQNSWKYGFSIQRSHKRLVGEVVHVLQDREPRHQPRRQRRMARAVRIDRAEPLPRESPSRSPRELRPADGPCRRSGRAAPETGPSARCPGALSAASPILPNRLSRPENHASAAVSICICGRPPPRKMLSNCFDRIACDHMSGLYVRPHMTAGQDGFRNSGSEQDCDLRWPLQIPEYPASWIDRSHHLLISLQVPVSAQHGCISLAPRDG